LLLTDHLNPGFTLKKIAHVSIPALFYQEVRLNSNEYSDLSGKTKVGLIKFTLLMKNINGILTFVRVISFAENLTVLAASEMMLMT